MRLFLPLIVSTLAGFAASQSGVVEVGSFDDHLPDIQLAAFGALVDGADVVALGEQTHGSQGFHSARHRLVRYLIEHQGFRAIAIEDNRAAAARVNDYIRSCKGSPEAAMSALFGVWKSTAVRDTIRWLCQFNETHPDDQVQFFGFDVQQPVSDAQRIIRWLDSNENGDLRAGIRSCFAAREESDDAAGDRFVSIRTSNPPDLSEESNGQCVSAIDGIRALTATDAANGDELLQISLDGLKYWQEMAMLVRSNPTDGPASSRRDLAMADIFLKMRDVLAPGQRVVLWAAGWHITKGYEYLPPELQELGVKMMGMYLEEQLRSKYVAVDLWGYDVQINRPGDESPARPTLDDVATKVMHDMGLKAAIISSSDSFLASRKLRQWSDDSPLFDLPKHFDGIIYIDESGPVVPVSDENAN